MGQQARGCLQRDAWAMFVNVPSHLVMIPWILSPGRTQVATKFEPQNDEFFFFFKFSSIYNFK